MKKIYCLLLLVIVLALSCSNGGGSGGGESSDPVLKNLGVTFAAYDSGSGLAGDFNFPKTAAITSNVITVFGSVLSGTQLNPTFEYLVDEDSDIYSLVDGTVEGVGYSEEHEDYTVAIIPTSATGWVIYHDHVTSVAVIADETVTAGQTIGKPGNWHGDLGRTEIQAYKNSDGLSYCPFTIFDTDTSAEYQNKVTDLMNEWETYMSDTTIYDQGAMTHPGCLFNSVDGG